MNIQEYEAQYEKVFCKHNVEYQPDWKNFTNPGLHGGYLTEGMLQFDEDSRANWAGPFEGGFAYYCVIDNRHLHLPTLAEAAEQHRFSHWIMPDVVRYQQGWKESAQNEEHLQKRLALLSYKDLKQWEINIRKMVVEFPTVENPFSLYMCGNDDCSYTKYYSTLEALQAELDLFLSDQPLNMSLHIYENGFVFTN